MMRRTALMPALLLVALLVPATAAFGMKKVSTEAPEELQRWSFLLGRWKMDSRRYSLEGPVIESNSGTATFSMALSGLRIQERHSTTLGGKPMETLSLFSFHPERKQWQVARTDSLHHTFGVMQGTGEGDSIVLFEKDPDPDDAVTRRLTYTKKSPDEFGLLLEFSEDKGKTWKRRNETVYTRAR